jgi:hypothetical protein
VWGARAHEAKKVCSRMKHIFTNRGECKRLSPMTAKCTPALGVTFVWEAWIFKYLVERAHKHHDLSLKCMNYDQKKGHESNWEFDSQPQIPLHSTCINHLFSLVLHVDFILNFCLWWRIPKSRVEPTWGFNYVELRKVGTRKAFPTSSTIKG